MANDKNCKFCGPTVTANGKVRCCGRGIPTDTSGRVMFICTRPKGHVGPCVACSKEEHDLCRTGVE